MVRDPNRVVATRYLYNEVTGGRYGQYVGHVGSVRVLRSVESDQRRVVRVDPAAVSYGTGYVHDELHLAVVLCVEIAEGRVVEGVARGRVGGQGRTLYVAIELLDHVGIGNTVTIDVRTEKFGHKHVSIGVEVAGCHGNVTTGSDTPQGDAIATDTVGVVAVHGRVLKEADGRAGIVLSAVGRIDQGADPYVDVVAQGIPSVAVIGYGYDVTKLRESHSRFYVHGVHAGSVNTPVHTLGQEVSGTEQDHERTFGIGVVVRCVQVHLERTQSGRSRYRKSEHRVVGSVGDARLNGDITVGGGEVLLRVQIAYAETKATR